MTDFGRSSFAPGRPSTAIPQKGRKVPKFFEETDAFVLSTFGGLLPIAAKDNLKNAASSSGLMDETSENILFVSSRNMYLWSLKWGEHGMKKFCLPSSAVAITRRHISLTVFPKSVALVCVTPSGYLRYWKTLTCPNAFSEAALPIRDQEVFSVVQVMFEKMVVATTNCTILFVDKNMASRELKMTSKSGFTSRLASVTSYFMPSSTSQEDMEQLKALLVPVRSEMCIMAISNLNLYLINFQEEKLVWCVNVCDALKPHLEDKDARNILVLNASYWGDESDLILLFSYKQGQSDASLYAFAHLSFDLTKSTAEFSVAIFPFDLNSVLSNPNIQVNINDCELYFPFTKFCDGCLVFKNGIIHLSSIFNENQEDCVSSIVDFSVSEDKIVAFGAYQGTILMLTAKRGLISFVSKYERQLREFQSVTSLQRTLQEIFEIYSAEPDQQLKQLLLIYRRAKSSNQFLSAAEPYISSLALCINLDAIVYECALSIANGYLDYNDAVASASTPTLNIENVLQEKLEVMAVFLNFLQQSKLIGHLKSLEELPHLGLKQPFPTLLAVCRIFENIGCMKTFYKLHCSNPSVFDPFIHVAVENRGTHSHAGDITLSFYKNASNFEELFDLIANSQKSGSLESNFDNAVSIMRLYIATFEKTSEIRQQNKHLEVTEENFCFWNLSDAFGDYIKAHFDWLKLNVDLFSSNVTTIELLQCHYDFAVVCLKAYGAFCELLSKAERKNELSSTMESRVKDMRSMFISFFAGMNQPTFSLGLAEKFLDFETLISICLDTKDFQKLSSYRQMFHDEEFDAYLIQILYNQGRVRTLVTLDSPLLTPFLKDVPQLRWVVEARQKEWNKATETLLELIHKNGHSFTFHKKRVLMAFAKMYAMMAHYDKNGHVFRKIESIFQVNRIQTNLPDLIKAKYALQDDRKSPVLDAKQLIDLLLEAVVSTLALHGTNVDDAVKYTLSALYLLDELGDEKVSDMAKLSIWAVVVSETDWERVDMNKPDCLTADLSKTFFFRVLSAVHQTSSPRHALSVGMLDLLLDPQTEIEAKGDVLESINQKLNYFEDADLKESIRTMATSCMEHIVFADADESK